VTRGRTRRLGHTPEYSHIEFVDLADGNLARPVMGKPDTDDLGRFDVKLD
jgi:hypothetical protein